MSDNIGAVTVFDPFKTTITIDDRYITGLGGTAISFSYSQDAVSAEAGLDGATVFTVNNAKLGTCTLPIKISSPQFEYLMELARNHTLFKLWCTDKSSSRRAGGNYSIFTRVPDYTADASDVSFSIIIADLDIDTC